ncbi:hypothetical protein N7509_007724 [Penicillium cosmopolitanum]|uniref:Uncharacterized protein n=1 Tax=Penicillium cosmopolitanum TaxID=1131564 RepID=A0A9W9VZJ5_9EURO|nr:uncharacterized protein N7509_007724 [Penicillium cosmopolitanum]KAJ5392234.1 hypothetical protein N7509_007724 [Penicillium cosmopolitanum]
MALVVSSQSGSTRSADPTLALREAVTEFEAILTDDQMRLYRSNNKIPDTTDPIVFVAAIDSNNEKRAGKTGQAVAPRLTTLLEATQQFSSVVGIFVNSNPLIAVSVWSGRQLGCEQ